MRLGRPSYGHRFFFSRTPGSDSSTSQAWIWSEMDIAIRIRWRSASGTLVYGCAALLLIRNVLRDYFSDALAVVTTIALCAGSFVIWYLTVENSMVHGVSMFSTTLFLFCVASIAK